jgi:hypothetical protein
MKKSVVLFLLLLFSLNVLAQEKDLKDIYTNLTTAINSALLTRAGAMEISGALSYNYFSTQYTHAEKSGQYIVQVEPAFSYFFVDNISLGINVSYLYQKTEYETADISTTIEQTFIGPIAKMYFGKEEFRPFILADYLFLSGDNYSGGELDFGAGIFYHLTGNFGFSLLAKYGFIWSDKENIDSQRRLFIGIGISNFIL